MAGAIHPVNPRVGGFQRAPTEADFVPLAERLRRALDDALATVEWVAGFDFPDVDLDHELLAVYEPTRYAIERGRVATAGGLTFPPSPFGDHIVKQQMPYSTALHASPDGRRYLTGPLARDTISSALLSPIAHQAAAQAASARRAVTRSAASSCVPSRPCTRPTRRCG